MALCAPCAERSFDARLSDMIADARKTGADDRVRELLALDAHENSRRRVSVRRDEYPFAKGDDQVPEPPEGRKQIESKDMHFTHWSEGSEK
jgi:hypothetical protein